MCGKGNSPNLFLILNLGDRVLWGPNFSSTKIAAEASKPVAKWNLTKITEMMILKVQNFQHNVSQHYHVCLMSCTLEVQLLDDAVSFSDSFDYLCH